MKLLRKIVRFLVKEEIKNNKEILDSDVEENEDDEDVNEFSAVGGGAIAGYTAPLGAKSNSKKDK